jgi:hypothetical protein
MLLRYYVRDKVRTGRNARLMTVSMATHDFFPFLFFYSRYVPPAFITVIVVFNVTAQRASKQDYQTSDFIFFVLS